MSFIFSNISHSFNQEFSAILQEIGYKITQDFFINNHEFIACSFVELFLNQEKFLSYHLFKLALFKLKKV